MAQAVKLQDPGEGIHDAEVVAVSVEAGDSVKQGQVVLVVETDKADFEIESPHSGVVEEVAVRVGDRVEVGQTLFTLEAAASAPRRGGDAATDGGREEPAEPEEEAEKTESRAGAGERAESTGADEGEADADADADEGLENGEARPEQGDSEEDDEARERPDRRDRTAPVPASPATRRLARDLGVDLRAVDATGEEGRILAQDVRAHAAGLAGRAGRARGERRDAGVGRARALPDFSRWGPVDRTPLRSVRRTIARRMGEAWESIPHVTHHDLADVTELDAFRRRQTGRLEAEGDKLTFTVLVMKAATAVLREFPRFNASLDVDEEEIIYKRYFHLGVATDTDRGLLVPSIRDVDRKSVRELAHELGELSARARSGALGRDEMRGGTFTITNVGAIGGTHFSPIINDPQVAILGLGRARWEPRLRDGARLCDARESAEVVPRLVLPLCLAFDHRVNDGADAARFMNRLVEILGDPEWFALTI